MQYDREQTEAINTVNTSILVSASAGAGKTGVLVARLVKRCVDDRVPLSAILAVTFTKAAAGEMKKRLARELNERKTTASDPQLISYLNEQLIALDDANITTIDSYCLTIIQKYYNVIGLDPATTQNIISEGTVNELKMQAYREALDHAYKRDKERTIRLLSYFSARSEDEEELHKTLDEINAHANSSLDPDAWYEKARNSYRKAAHFNDLDPSVLEDFFAYYRLRVSQLRENMDLMRRYGENEKKWDEEGFLAKYNALLSADQQLEEKNYNSFITAFTNFALLKTKAITANTDYTDARNKVQGSSSLTNKILKDLYPASTLVKDSNSLSDLVEDLVDLARETNDLFQKEKRDNACMDFTDMERYALDILNQNKGTVAGMIRDSLQEIMIDEFQDTSELQNAIIEKIAKKDDVFRVGDVKQSIYRFRQAKPSLMRGLKQDPDNKLITLRHNFRSRDSIVRFTNLLFDKIMDVEGCADTYEDADKVTIGADYQKEEHPVPVVFVDVRGPETEEDTQEEETPGTKELKAAWIAQQIIEMKNKEGLKFKDFAVLTRAHQDKKFLRAAFEKTNIAYDIDAREGFYQSVLCQTMIAWCRLLSDPADTISLLAVVTSGFYRLSDEELAKLKIRYQDIRTGIREAHPEIMQEIEELRQLSRSLSMPELLSNLVCRHEYIEHLDSQDKANFDFLFQKTSASHVRNLSEFLDLLNSSEDEKSSEAMSAGKDDDVVTVTTIHHSKGLQYKVVFLWSTQMNKFSDSASPVLIDDDLTLGLKYIELPYRIERPTIQRLAVSYRAGMDDLEEFTRLLYVALTRAEQRLFIVDHLKKDIHSAPVTLSVLHERKGITGLILKAMDEGPLFERREVTPDPSIINTPMPRKGVSVLPHFDLPVETLAEISTPSSTEVRTLPDLDPAGKSTGTNYGTIMHEWAAKLPDRPWTPKDVEAMPLPQSSKEALLAFSQSALYQEALSGTIHKEYPFYIEREDFRLNGTMDFISILEDKILLIDFKTDNASLEEIRNRYSDQLNAYRKALKILYNKPVSAYAYSFHNNDKIEIEEKP